MPGRDDSLPVEEFIQALTSQLDRAQRTLALKAKAGLPLTFAVKEMEVDLRAHLYMEAGRVRMQSAGPSDVGASVMRLSFTTITRPMIEQNTFTVESEDVSLDEALGEEVTEEERRRLEWAGIHTVSQLRQLEREGGPEALQQLVQVPAARLRQALTRASRPVVRTVGPVATPGPSGDGASTPTPTPQPGPVATRPPLDVPLRPDASPTRPLLPTPVTPTRPIKPIASGPARPTTPTVSGPTRPSLADLGPAVRAPLAPDLVAAAPTVKPGRRLLRVGGANFLRDGGTPTVRIGGAPVSVVQATDHELLLDVPEGPLAGDLVVEPPSGRAATFSLDALAAADAPEADDSEGAS